MALTTSASDAIIFQMASQISKEHPQIDIPTAISIAAKLLPVASQMGGRTTTPAKKPKKPRSKNAYMFYLAEKREEFKAELTQIAKEKDPDAKLRVTDVTKLAGSRWKALSMTEKIPYEQMAAEAKLKLQQDTASTTDNTSDGHPAGTGAAAAPETMAVKDTSGAAVPSNAPPSSTNNGDIFSSDDDDDDDAEENGAEPNLASVSAKPPVPPS